MDFLILIKNGCDNLTATVAPSVDSLGLRMVLSLATIMLVWFGIQEALASAQGGPGFSLGKFLSFFVLITFAYSFVKFYDGSIPGIGYSLKGFVSGGTSSLVDYIGSDSTQEVQNTIHTALSKVGTCPLHLRNRTRFYVLTQFRSSCRFLRHLSGSSLPMGPSVQRSLACLGRCSSPGWYSTKQSFCSGVGSRLLLALNSTKLSPLPP